MRDEIAKGRWAESSARIFLVLAAALAGTARAQDDPDTEVASRHFARATAAYDARDYETALKEFEAAKRAKASSALDYNIGRCYDRTER